jgi:hypothetical protein
MTDTYPTRAEDATALGLARLLARSAYARCRSQPARAAAIDQAAIDADHKTALHGLNQDSAAAMYAEYATAMLLTALDIDNRHQADQLARMLWRQWDNTTALTGHLEEWLRIHGIDPREVSLDYPNLAEPPARGRQKT